MARSADGTQVECWAMPPAGAVAGRRYPTLLNVHGGPFTQYGNKFTDDFQLQAAAGFGVLYCNPRGSSGYSELWGRAIPSPSPSTTRARAGARSTTRTCWPAPMPRASSSAGSTPAGWASSAAT